MPVKGTRKFEEITGNRSFSTGPGGASYCPTLVGDIVVGPGPGGSTGDFTPSFKYVPAAGDAGAALGSYGPYGDSLLAWSSSPDTVEFRQPVPSYDGTQTLYGYAKASSTLVDTAPPWAQSATGKSVRIDPTTTPVTEFYLSWEPGSGMHGWDGTGATPATRTYYPNVYAQSGDAGKKIAWKIRSTVDDSIIHDFGEFTLVAGWQQFPLTWTYSGSVPQANHMLQMHAPALSGNAPTLPMDTLVAATPSVYGPPTLAGLHYESAPQHQKWGVLHQMPSENAWVKSRNLIIEGTWTDGGAPSGNGPFGQPLLARVLNMQSGAYLRPNDISSVTASAPYISPTDGAFRLLRVDGGGLARFAEVTVYLAPAGAAAMPTDGQLTVGFDGQDASGAPLSVANGGLSVRTALVRDAAASKLRRSDGGSWYRSGRVMINDLARAEGTVSTGYAGATGDVLIVQNGSGIAHNFTMTAGQSVAAMVAAFNALIDPNADGFLFYVAPSGGLGVRATLYASGVYRDFTLSDSVGLTTDHLGLVDGLHRRGEVKYVQPRIFATATVSYDLGPVSLCPEQYTDTRQFGTRVLAPPPADETPVVFTGTMAGFQMLPALNRTNGVYAATYVFPYDAYTHARQIAESAPDGYCKLDLHQGGRTGAQGESVDGQIVAVATEPDVRVSFTMDDYTPDGTPSGLPADNSSMGLRLTAPGQWPAWTPITAIEYWSDRGFDGCDIKVGLAGSWVALSAGDVYNGVPVTINYSGTTKTDPAYDHLSQFNPTPTYMADGSDRDFTGENGGWTALVMTSNAAAARANAQAAVDIEHTRIASRWTALG